MGLVRKWLIIDLCDTFFYVINKKLYVKMKNSFTQPLMLSGHPRKSRLLFGQLTNSSKTNYFKFKALLKSI